METAVIDIPRHKAWEEVKAYRQLARQRHTAEDVSIQRGYAQVLKGRRLISLNQTFKRAGFNEDHTPKLAVARADAKFVRCKYEWRNAESRLTFWWAPGTDWSHGRNETYLGASHLNLDRFVRPSSSVSPTKQAIVPIVPPALRPNAALSNYHVLFEAEWRQVAPRDPALLKYIGGDLWAVLTTWDLTELERAVLAERR